MATVFKQAFDDAKVFSGWPAPDLSILRQGIAAPVFPESLLGDLAPIVRGLAVSGGTSFDFVAMSLLSMAASIIGSKRRIKPYAASPWTEPAVLWVGLVCPPSSGKSPAIKPLSRIMSSLQADYRLEHQEDVRAWETEKQRAGAEHKLWEDSVAKSVKDGLEVPILPATAVAPREPVARRFYVNDTTPEALARILVGNPQGLAVIADELSSWFASFDRYSGDTRGFWLTAYNGEPHVIDRKGNPEPIFIPFLGASLLGGIQPSKLAEAFKGANDGLHSRLLWVWADAVPYVVPSVTPDLDTIEVAFRGLDSLAWGSNAQGERDPIILPLDRDASDAFVALATLNSEERMDAPDSLLMAAVGKMPGQVVRLALTLELLKWSIHGGPEPREVKGETMAAACDFMQEYIRPMAARVYGDAALPEGDRRLVGLARWIRKSKPSRFNASNDILKQRAAFGFKCKDELQAALDGLCEAGWIKFDGKRDGPTKGRQSSDYTVNPQLTGL